MRSKVAHLATRSVRYLEAGSGKPLVWLHAFPLSADQWLPQMSRVPSGWRFIAPDLRGFRGAGPAFDEVGLEGQTIDGYATDVLELMTHLDVPAATIGGLSMGGYVAFAMVHRAPDRVAGLVLANTRAAADSPQGRVNRTAMLERLSRDGVSAIADEMVPKLLGETTRRDQPDLVEVVTRLVLTNTPEAIAAAVRAMRERPDSTPLLRRLACPVTLIHGAEDVLIPVAEAERMRDAIPGARLVVLPAVGHLSNLEDPAGFTAAIAL
ncbi:MAG TPA: alpha/beta hydrolase [Vicinamibacterales bacterium]|nr:alpha/beta hydrolase [Vicinamibacterales bacterium]